MSNTPGDAASGAEATSGAIPCLVSASAIAERVALLARQISADYAGTELVVVGVLKGAFVFMADLVRQLSIPVRCEFMMASSYGMDLASSGMVDLRLDVRCPVEGQHVLMVEDIVDTGLCVSWLREHLRRKGPASIRLCALLDKPARRRIAVEIDYLGFTIPDRFVVGYGIDCAEEYRQLPYVGYLPQERDRA